MQDLTGKKFGRLTVLELAYKKGYEKYYKCQCECGTIKYIRSNSLTCGHSLSCGCLHSEIMKKYITERNTTHNLSKHPLHNIWQHIKKRCYNKNTPQYDDYGGRGIKICDEWLNDFKAFYDWAIDNGYKKGLSIDRINNNGNYEPNNCRWATRKEQNNNTRRNFYITYNNETHTLAEWAEIKNINSKTLWQRFKRNWSVERAFNTP